MNDAGMRTEQIVAELDALPLPYCYDFRPFDSIKLSALRAHIEGVGVLPKTLN